MKIGLLAGLFPFKHIVKLKQIKENKTKKATAIHFNGGSGEKVIDAQLLVLGFVPMLLKTSVEVLPKRSHSGSPNVSLFCKGLS